MYKKIFDEIRQNIRTRNKVIYFAGGEVPTNRESSSNSSEKKEAIKRLTKKEIQSFKNKIETDIRFVNRDPRKNYDLNVYKEGTQVEITRNENLRNKESLKVESRVKTGQKLELTGEYKVLENKKNGSERVYWVVKNSSGEEFLIHGESINPKGAAQKENQDTQANSTNDELLTETQAFKELQSQTRKAVSEKADQFKKEATENASQQGSEKASNVSSKAKESTQEKVVPRKTSLEEAISWASQHETIAVNPPKNLKYAIDQEQIPYEARITINDTLNKYGITLNEFQNMMEGNTLSLDDLLQKSITEEDSEYKAIENKYEQSLDNQRVNKIKEDIKDLEQKAKDLDKSSLRYKSIQRRISRKENRVQRLEANNQAQKQEFIRSEIQKLTTKDYVSRTHALEDYKEGKYEQDVARRHDKIKDLVILQKTMYNLGNFEANQENLTGEKLERSKRNLSPDNIEFVEVDPKLEASLISKLDSKEWRQANNISEEQAQQLEKIIRVENNSLILLATLLYSEGSFTETQGKAFYSYTKPGKEGAILRPNRFNEDNFLELLNLVNIGLYNDGVLRENNRIDNLSEATLKIQQAPNYLNIRQEAYQNKLEQINNIQNQDVREQALMQAHLQRILDTNLTGPYSVQNGIFNKEKVSTQSQADYMGGVTKRYENPSTIKGKSELSLYNDLIDQIATGSQLDKQKFEATMNKYMELGKIGIYYDPNLNETQRQELLSLDGLYLDANSNTLNPKAVSLIRYGLIYDDMYENFSKSDRSPDKKFEKAGINNPQMVYPAIAEALTVIETENLTNLAVGTSSEIQLGNGYTLEAAGGGSIQVNTEEFRLTNPSLGAGASVTLSKDLSDKLTWNVLRVSGGAGANTKNIAKVSLHGALETGIDYKVDEYTSLGAGINVGVGKLLFIDGVPVPTLNFTMSGERRGIDKAEDEMYYTNAERLTSTSNELSPQGKAIMEKLRQGEEINLNEMDQLEKELLFLRAPFENDPRLQDLSPEEVFEYQKAILITMNQRLENISTEKARGLNVGVSFTVGTIIGTGIPYFIPTVQFEWKGKRVEKYQAMSNGSIEDQTVISQLKEDAKNLSKGETVEYTTQSGVFIIDDQGEIRILKPAQELSEIKATNYEQKLQSLREHTGLNFQRTETNGKFKVSNDDYKLRQNLDSRVQNSEELEIHVDPILQDSISIQGLGNGEFTVEFKDGKIPSNLLILREDRILPTTLGKANSFSKISFTTSERSLTGSEMSDLQGYEYYQRFNEEGQLESVKLDSSLNRNQGVTDTLEYNQTISPQEALSLANSSEYILSRTAESLGTHKPKAELDVIVKKLTGDKKTLEKLAEYTTKQLEKGQDIEVGKAIALIKETAGEDVNLNKEDLIYILGNVNPYTFRSINELSVKEREQAAEKLANQYVTEYVTSLAENGYVRKSNGEKFSKAEQEVIISILQYHSGIKDSFRDNILKEGNVITEQIGVGKHQGLEGSILLTTAHRGNLRGLRQTVVSRVNPTEIIADSYTNLNQEGIPKARLDLVKEFLVGIHDSVIPVENLQSYEDLTEKTKAAILRTLSSKTAMLMTNIRAFQNNGQEIALIGLMYGPENLEAINKFYRSVDSTGQFPEELLQNPENFQAIMKFINDIQQVHNTYDGQVKFEDMNGNPVEINLQTEAGVVLIGNCANPTYVYNRKMTANTQLTNPELGAARARSNAGSFNQGKSKAKLRRIGFGTKIEPKPATTPITPKTPRKTGDEIPGGGGGGNETPRKTGGEIPTPEPENIPDEVTDQRSDRADRANRRNN